MQEGVKQLPELSNFEWGRVDDALEQYLKREELHGPMTTHTSKDIDEQGSFIPKITWDTCHIVHKYDEPRRERFYQPEMTKAQWQLCWNALQLVIQDWDADEEEDESFRDAAEKIWEYIQ